MKQKVLTPLVRSMIKEMQARYSLLFITHFWPMSSKAKAKILARFILDFSELYSIDPKAVRCVPTHPFAGVPFIGSFFKANKAELFIYAFGLIKHK